MSAASSSAPPDPARPRWPAAAIAALAIAAYARTLNAPFIFDDRPSIAGNPTLGHLLPALSPPLNTTVACRPVLNLSFSLNYALSGSAVWSYHALNLLIHVAAALTLWGLVRRTLDLRGSRWTEPLALSAALLWALHPLQTEAVTYTVQRAESLMGLFYLLTLYFFVRGWPLPAILACLLGMGTKEVMVSAPVTVLLFDRTFLAGSFRAAWRRRWPVHLGLAATWIPLGVLVASGGGTRGGATTGFGIASWFGYVLTQFPALCRYLKLTFWPRPLIFEYPAFAVAHPLSVFPQALFVGGLAGLTVVALWRWPVWGFLGYGFFAVLAPTSLVPGTVEMISERRMYLALAPVVILVVAGIYGWLGRLATPLCWTVAAVLLFATARRNEVYRTEEALWRDTVRKAPDSELAHLSLGMALSTQPGHLPAAISEFEQAVRLEPNDPYAHFDLANAWFELPRHLPEAMAEYQAAIRLHPTDPQFHNNCGNGWLRVPGRRNLAMAEFRTALLLNPDFAEAHNNLAIALAQTPGRMPDAIAEFQQVLRLKPDDYEARFNLALAYLQIPGHLSAAKALLESASRLQPDNRQIQAVLGSLQHGP